MTSYTIPHWFLLQDKRVPPFHNDLRSPAITRISTRLPKRSPFLRASLGLPFVFRIVFINLVPSSSAISPAFYVQPNLSQYTNEHHYDMFRFELDMGGGDVGDIWPRNRGE